MNLFFFLEARYIEDDQGLVYNPEGVLKFPLWDRYLEVYDHIVVVARVQHVPGYVGNAKHLASGARVSFIRLPYFYGPLDFLKKRHTILRRIDEITDLNGVFLLRCPGQIGTIASRLLIKKRKKYGVEVVGDPIDVFSKGAIKHPLRIFFKYKYYYDLRRVVTNASSVLYVTEQALQVRYPATDKAYTTHASNVVLKQSYVKKAPKEYKQIQQSYSLISIGSLEQMYKAPDIVLQALRKINDMQNKYVVKLTWIGAGRYIDEMRELAIQLQVNGLVNFKGYISDKQQIINSLDNSDLFVLASRTEGLPRVMIEAMARGLPVIGTRVGGIPELISKDFLVEKNDPEALALKIKFLLENPDIATIESRRNLEKSKDFSEVILAARRKKFYRSLIQDFKKER